MEPEQVSQPGSIDVIPPMGRLIPHGIENFVPSCVVCRNPVPKKRATSRSKDTCSPECQTVLRKFRRHVLVSSKCPSCYHPSTPEERKEFIAWRKWRGDRRAKRGRPPITEETKLRAALSDAVKIIRQFDDAGYDDYAKPTSEEITAVLAQCEKLIDTKDSGQSTLAPSGPTA